MESTLWSAQNADGCGIQTFKSKTWISKEEIVCIYDHMVFQIRQRARKFSKDRLISFTLVVMTWVCDSCINRRFFYHYPDDEASSPSLWVGTSVGHLCNAAIVLPDSADERRKQMVGMSFTGILHYLLFRYLL